MPRSPSPAAAKRSRFASRPAAHASGLYGAFFVKEYHPIFVFLVIPFLYGAPRQGLDCGCGITAFSSFIFLHPSFFVRLEKPVSSPRPTLDERRRAQDLSRTRTCAPVRALSLTGPSTAADLGKLGLRRATVSGSASCQATAKRPLNLISGRLEWEPNPYPTYWGRKRPGWTGTIFWPALKP